MPRHGLPISIRHDGGRQIISGRKMNPINSSAGFFFTTLAVLAAAMFGGIDSGIAPIGLGAGMIICVTLLARSPARQAQDRLLAGAIRMLAAMLGFRVAVWISRPAYLRCDGWHNPYREVGAIGNLGRLRRPTTQRASGRQHGGATGRKKQTKSSASDDSDGGGGEPPAEEKPRKILVVLVGVSQ